VFFLKELKLKIQSSNGKFERKDGGISKKSINTKDAHGQFDNNYAKISE
jgi:hypothetical protein